MDEFNKPFIQIMLKIYGKAHTHDWKSEVLGMFLAFGI